MEQDPRLLEFIEKALSLLERMQQTPTSSYESMKLSVHTLIVRLLEANDLLIQEQAGPVVPMREDVRTLIVSVKQGILEYLGYFEVHSSEEYKSFIAAKKQIDEFLSDPRATEFVSKALECVEYIQLLPDAKSISMQLHDLHISLVDLQNTLKYTPERGYEESFISVVERTVNGLARIAGPLPDFAKSDAYGAFRQAGFHAGLFISGLPFVPQKLEADS